MHISCLLLDTNLDLVEDLTSLSRFLQNYVSLDDCLNHSSTQASQETSHIHTLTHSTHSHTHT